MLKGLKEALNRCPRAYYIVIEKFGREVITEGYRFEVLDFDYPGYQVADEIYIGDGILRVVIIEEN